MTIFNNSIYVYGGATDYGPSSDFWKYDLERYVWTEIDVKGDFPSEKAFAAYYTFEWNNTTFMAMFGGYTQISSSNSLYL
jgi:uncharacterized protein Usg